MKISNTARHFVRVFIKSGPVGLIYALRLAWVSRRLAVTSRMLQCERELHRANLEALSSQLKALVSAQQRLHISAAAYWTQVNANDSQANVHAKGAQP